MLFTAGRVWFPGWSQMSKSLCLMKTTLEPIPVWALCYLINADPSGLEDDEIKSIDKWMEQSGVKYVCIPEEENPYFSAFPAFGLASDVYDCICVLSWD